MLDDADARHQPCALMVSRKPAVAILPRQEEVAMFKSIKKDPGRELMPIDEVVGNLPFIVRRDHRIVGVRQKAARDRLGRAAVVQ